MTAAPSVRRRPRPDEYPPPGTRVRLNARAFSGWKGTATMLGWHQAIKDGCTDPSHACVDAAAHEWVVLRDQAESH
jgi:hypothetical protein